MTMIRQFPNPKMDRTEITLRKDSEWKIIEGLPCRVISFTALAAIKNKKILATSAFLPYASVTIECKEISKTITGFITHKVDFKHLWMAFKERGLSDNEEMMIVWTTKSYKFKFLKILSIFLPKLWVVIWPKGAFELETNPNYRPELQGVERFKAVMPIVELKSEVMA